MTKKTLFATATIILERASQTAPAVIDAALEPVSPIASAENPAATDSIGFKNYENSN